MVDSRVCETPIVGRLAKRGGQEQRRERVSWAADRKTLGSVFLAETRRMHPDPVSASLLRPGDRPLNGPPSRCDYLHVLIVARSSSIDDNFAPDSTELGKAPQQALSVLSSCPSTGTWQSWRCLTSLGLFGVDSSIHPEGAVRERLAHYSVGVL